MSPSPVVVLNAVCLNGGDAAIMLAIREHIRAAFGPSTEMLVSDAQWNIASRFYPEVTFVAPAAAALARRRSLPRGGRALARIDQARWLTAARLKRRAPALSRVLLRPCEFAKLEQYADAGLAISTGGTYLVEHYSLTGRLFEMRLMLALGVPLVLYTQSLGPFEDEENRRLIKDVVDRAALVLLRDERSRDNLLEIGVAPDRLQVVADAVFTFSAPPARPAARRPSRIAVSVRHWPHNKRMDGPEGFHRGVVSFVSDAVRRHGAEVTFLSTCQGIPEYWTDDSREAYRIADALPDDVKPSVKIDAAFHHPRGLIEELRAFDFVVSTRMHLAILALSAGVPVLPIAYEFKTRELFARLGLDRFVLDIEDVSGDALADAFERFVSEPEASGDRLWEMVERERQLADQAASSLRAALKAT